VQTAGMGQIPRSTERILVSEIRVIGLCFVCHVIDLSSLKLIFYGGLNKTLLFLQVGRFSCSRSSKVNNIGANRKRVRNLLLVHNSNLGPILHRFGAMARFMCYDPTPIQP